jgi:hypothetical protein
MAIDQTDVVDFIGVDRKMQRVVLSISDHLLWEDDNHLGLLQSKINKYLDFIESGEIYKVYPNAKDKAICINLICKYQPNANAKEFIDYVKTAIHDTNISFFYEVSND